MKAFSSKPTAVGVSLVLFVLGVVVGWYSPDTIAVEFAVFSTGLVAGFVATVKESRPRLGLLMMLLNCVGLVFAAMELPLPWSYHVIHH
jgi:hypothetical protein